MGYIQRVKLLAALKKRVSIEKNHEIWGKLIFKTSKKQPYMYIWRVEESGSEQGPYIGGYGDDSWQDEPHKGSPTRPAPSEDPGFKADKLSLVFYDENLLSGFSTVTDLKKWFSDNELKKLKKRGFHVVKKKAAEVWKGKYQVLYIPYDDYEG